ncbi:hypothetical protein Hanom_Chr10g00931931 [Helianthus anomalus]
MGISENMENDVEDDHDLQSPELVQDQAGDGAHTEVDHVMSETSEGPINGNDASDLNNLNAEENDGEGFNGEFIPGVEFPFDQDIDPSGSQPVNHVNKRKKFKKTDLGRPSVGYTSSQESLKVIKRAKNDEDLFGIDKLLGLSNSQLDQVGKGPDLHNGFQHSTVLDLNTQPLDNAPQ